MFPERYQGTLKSYQIIMYQGLEKRKGESWVTMSQGDKLLWR